MDERTPDHTDDPRGEDVAEGGYPEEQQSGTDPGGGDPHREGDTDAPDTSADEEGDPGQATGNPDAAG